MMRLFTLALLCVALPLGAGQAQMGNSTLPPGHPPIDRMPPAPTLSHSGTVLETLAAPPYVYIRVKGESGDAWLAAPAVGLAKGTKIRWPDGLAMANFHSKMMDRTFDSVTFVDSVAVAGDP